MILLLLAKSLLIGSALAASPAPHGNVKTIINTKAYYPAFREIFDQCAKGDFADDNFDEFRSLFSESTGPTSNLKSFSQLFVVCISTAKSHREDARQFFQSLTVDSSTLVGWGYEGLSRIGESQDADFIMADASRRADRRRQADVSVQRMSHPGVPQFLLESFHMTSDPIQQSNLLVELAATGSTLTITAARISLDSGWWSNRRMAVGMLARFKDRESVPLLVSKLNDTQDLVRSAIVDALGQIGDPAAVAAIRTLQKDPSPRVRERAISSLVWLDAATDEDFKLALQDQDSRVREIAMRIYSANGAGVDFVKISKDNTPQARADAALQLGRLWGKDAEPRLRELLLDSNPTVQTCAAIAMWANERADGEAILRKSLESTSDHDMLLGLASAFARIGNEKSLKSLERIYHTNWSPTARSNAAIMFYGIGEGASINTIKAWKTLERDPAVKKTISEIIEGKY